jgi:hypothetical protein
MIAEVLLVIATLMVASVGQWIVFDQTSPFFQSFNTKLKTEWVNRINAMVVDSLLVGFALLEGHTSHWGLATVLGYFLFDVIHMLLYDATYLTGLSHHVISITVVGLGKLAMTAEQAASATTAAAILMSTSPLLNLTWLLHKSGNSTHPMFKYIAALMAVSYGVIRLGILPWFMATKMDRITAAVFLPLLGLSVYWFYQIAKMGQKFFMQGMKAEDALNSAQSPEASSCSHGSKCGKPQPH